MQDENVALDKKKQILNSLNLRNLDNNAATEKYKEVVLRDDIIDNTGKTTESGTQGGENCGFKLGNSDYKEGKLALYICKVDGETKYVIPVYGMGLWGGISGYIAINADKNTVFGAYFNHESETAGLGSEIKDSKEWQEKFIGKKIFSEQTKEVALSVSKKVTDKTTQVDGVTGATLTSDGVTNMLKDCLSQYKAFLNK